MLKLAVFDLDGTLKVEPDPYVYLHRRLGVMAEAKAITEAGMRGELSYEAWLRADAMLWRGTPRTVVEQYFREDVYLPGAQQTLATLQARGVTLAILSTGLLLHAEMVAKELGIPHIFGNEIFFTENHGQVAVVSGEVKAHIAVDQKGAFIEQLQTTLNVTPGETLAVGDARGDLPMFAHAGVSVAVAPRHPEVAAAADIVLPTPDLGPLLPRVMTYAPHWQK